MTHDEMRAAWLARALETAEELAEDPETTAAVVATVEEICAQLLETGLAMVATSDGGVMVADYRDPTAPTIESLIL